MIRSGKRRALASLLLITNTASYAPDEALKAASCVYFHLATASRLLDRSSRLLISQYY